MAKAVTMLAALPTVTPNSPAICGSSGSQMRKLAALANAATASNAMVRVGVSSVCVVATVLTMSSTGTWLAALSASGSDVDVSSPWV